MNSTFAIACALGLVAAPSLADSRQEAPLAEDELIGIWRFHTDYGPPAHGRLTVTRRGAAWKAALAGAKTTFTVTEKTVRFAFPGEMGRFRGVLTDDERAIEGFWIRPAAGDAGPNAASTQAFASPLELKLSGRGSWQGVVRRNPDSFTLFLRVFRDENGALLGAFRNHDQNSTGGAQQFRVYREGSTVRFVFPPSSGGTEVRHEAKLAGKDVLKMKWPDLARDIELKRCTSDQAAAFFPRPPGDPPYRYRRPREMKDGWSTGRASDVGIGEEALTAAIQKLIDADPAARRPSLLHSILVARRGKLVIEEYFFGQNRETLHDLRSAGKTFSSVMLGAAMMKGVPISPETKLYDVVAGMGPFANPDPRKSQITLAHLMTHTAGLAVDDNDDASPGNEGTMQTQTKQPNWWKYTLDLPMAHDPGERYAYGSANMNLVGAALTAATKTWLPELFDRTIARPLQFGPYQWNLMPNDEGYLGGGAWLRPRDLLKVGQAFLDGGVWHGRRIVDASWVKSSTAPRIHISPASTGLTPEKFGDFYGEADDGYAWHLGSVRGPTRVYPTYVAAGNGGQLLIVIPELEMVVVFTGGNYGQGGIWGRWGNLIVGGAILPAITK